MNKNNQIIEELINLKQVILSDKNKMEFTKYSPMFAFTTENISGYLNKLNVEGSNMLVPCASGDHALEAILKGAESVDIFDINAYAYHMMQLKIAAIKSLNKNEFINFFANKIIPTEKNDEFLNPKVYYEKIRENIPQYSKNYWDQVYAFLKNGRNIRISGLVMPNNGNVSSLTSLIDYLKEDNYDILKERITKLEENKVDYFNCNVIDLPKVLDKQYDLILLSNIQDYISNSYNCKNTEALMKYRKFIDNELSKFMTSDGKIVSEYFYYYSILTNIKPGEKQEMIELPATFNIYNQKENGPKDVVMVYSNK